MLSLAKRVVTGEVLAAARLMRRLEDDPETARAELEQLLGHGGKARMIGFTGAPGAGKSTLVSALVSELRRRGQRVGVLCVDPSSPFSGGAILGDRIRMTAHDRDPGVFIRSVATRGHQGGLARSTWDMARVMDAMGLDWVLIETVGVGQNEVEIMKVTHLSVVVMVPGLGDEIQMVKAGLLEIGDLFVLNKADMPGAGRTLGQLYELVHLQNRPPELEAPVLQTVAVKGEGVAELADALAQRWQTLGEAGHRRQRLHQAARGFLIDELIAQFRNRISRRLQGDSLLDALLDEMVSGAVEPYAVARKLLAEMTEGWDWDG